MTSDAAASPAAATSDAAATSPAATTSDVAAAGGVTTTSGPGTGGVAVSDEGVPARPGETYQDFVLNTDEDPGDDGTEIRPERVFVPGAKEAIRLRPGTSELYLMTQLRDEAHRFAITHHRKRRGKRALHSALDDIPGVGPAIKKALLQTFGTVAAIGAAEDSALTAIKGVGPALARKIRESIGHT
jgi:excinuclease ABC subunit C